MTHEEKQILREMMESVVSPLKQELTETKAELKADIQNTNSKMDSMYISLKEDISTSEREIKTYIENTAEKHIKTVAEGHLDIRRDLKELRQLDKDVSDLKDRVFALEMKAKQG